MTPDKSVKMFVTFWGTRGSLPTPGNRTQKYGGNTPCVTVRYDDTLIIIDAGTGIRDFGLDLLQQNNDWNSDRSLHLLLSHTHWDHIQGLPFFAPAYTDNVKLTIYGSPHKGTFLESILQGQMDVNYFPVEMNAFAADISITEISEEKIQIGALTIDWQEQIFHPGGSVRFRFHAGGKKMVYASDVELNKIFCSEKQSRESKMMASEYNDFIHGADLLIADAQYTEEEYFSKVGWGHTTIPLILDIAHKQNVRQLALFHHEPQHSDSMLDKLSSEYVQTYRSAVPPMNAFWAREGMTLAI